MQVADIVQAQGVPGAGYLLVDVDGCRVLADAPDLIQVEPEQGAGQGFVDHLVAGQHDSLIRVVPGQSF
jgi:hypothetical protein